MLWRNISLEITVLLSAIDNLIELKRGQSCETRSADELHCNSIFQELKVLSHVHTVQTNIDKSNSYLCDNNMETLVK